jgi:hypothetical protein
MSSCFRHALIHSLGWYFIYLLLFHLFIIISFY